MHPYPHRFPAEDVHELLPVLRGQPADFHKASQLAWSVVGYAMCQLHPVTLLERHQAAERAREAEEQARKIEADIVAKAGVKAKKVNVPTAAAPVLTALAPQAPAPDAIAPSWKVAAAAGKLNEAHVADILQAAAEGYPQPAIAVPWELIVPLILDLLNRWWGKAEGEANGGGDDSQPGGPASLG